MGMMTVNPHYPTSFHIDPDVQRFNIHDMTYDLHSGEVIESQEKEEISIPEDRSRYGLTSMDGSLKFTMGYEKHDRQICVLDA